MNRLEEHIKNTLQNREITPSPDAWSRISEELKTEGKPPAKNSHWWAIAAGFAGIILIATVFFNNRSSVEETDSPAMVEQEVQSVDSEENIDPVQSDDGVLTSPQNELVIESLPESDPVKKDALFVAAQKKEPLAQNDPAMDKKPLDATAGVSEGAIKEKLESVMAQVHAMEENAIVVSDAEIDSLILAAQRELLTQKAVRDNGDVDAMALLDEVELELYDEKRNQLFNRLKEGFFRLRTAVADRNN